MTINAYEQNRFWRENLPPGWDKLFRDLVDQVAMIDPDIQIVYVKEKFASLRVRFDRGDERVDAAYRMASERSLVTCQICGKTGEVMVDPAGTYATLCPNHAGSSTPIRRDNDTSEADTGKAPPKAQGPASLLPWPLFTIDFEASSLDPGTYPIEVGICRWTSPAHPIEGWSTLIRPTAQWIEHGSWSPASAEVHGIGQEELEAGMTPTEAITALNAIMGTAASYCDGGAYDINWARMLARASGVRATFRIGDFDLLTGAFDQLAYMRLVRWLDRAPPRHRARDDAERLMKALARGLKLDHGSPVTIVPPDDG